RVSAGDGNLRSRSSAATASLRASDPAAWLWDWGGLDEPLDVRRLPRALGRDEHFFNSQRTGSRTKFQPINPVSISEQRFGRRGKREGLAQLLGGPNGRRCLGDLEAQHLPAMVVQHDAHIQQPKRQGGKRE